MVARRWIPVSACVQCVRVFNEQVMRCVQRAGRRDCAPSRSGGVTVGLSCSFAPLQAHTDGVVYCGASTAAGVDVRRAGGVGGGNEVHMSVGTWGW